MDYVKHHKIKLTKTRNLLTKKDLRPLHAHLAEHGALLTKKANQDDYPLIHLLFHLALTLRLTRKSALNNDTILILNPEMIDTFKALRPPEQYVTMLDVFWTKMDWGNLQERRYNNVKKIITVLLEEIEKLERLPQKEVLMLEESTIEHLQLNGIRSFLCFWSYFGFMNVSFEETAIADTGQLLQTEIKSVELKPLMQKLSKSLLDTWDAHGNANKPMQDFFSVLIGGSELEMDEEPAEDENEELSLFAMLQPLFEENVVNTLPVEDSGPFHGNITFKVSLFTSCWRRIQLPASATLLDLHRWIQEAFAFDDDHMYSFFMDGKRFSEYAFKSPMDCAGPYVQEAVLGKLDLYEGMRFLYLFDYGDEWQFDIFVEKLAEEEEELPGILAVKGESPEQYPGW
ncbi:hypothetical protein KK120_22785 [Virgibacillus dakarensis]|nr:hypothetical protein [Virgibacillus dakarensis]